MYLPVEEDRLGVERLENQVELRVDGNNLTKLLMSDSTDGHVGSMSRRGLVDGCGLMIKFIRWVKDMQFTN